MARKINQYQTLKKLQSLPKQKIQYKKRPQKAPLFFTTQEILNATIFYDSTLEESLQQAMQYENKQGGILTFPELIQGVLSGGVEHQLYNNLISVYTEEHVGIDLQGKYYDNGEYVLLTIHGGGIFTPEIIIQHKNSILKNGIISYSQKEFDMLLDGLDILGQPIVMYTYEQIKEGIKQLPHKFGVITPYNLVKQTHSGSYTKEEFISNPLIITRAGGSKYLKKYYDYAATNASIECYHPFNLLTFSQPQGYLLFASTSDSLIAYYGHESIGYPGHFARIERIKNNNY